jgi:hypothetical protein
VGDRWHVTITQGAGMGETLSVDKGKLRQGAKIVEDAAKEIEVSAGKQSIAALALAEQALAGSVSAGSLPRVGRSLAEVSGDMVTAMRGLAEGLQTAANRFHTVDIVLGEATQQPGPTPRNLL